MKLKIVNGTYDEAAREAFKINPASTISFYLAASYLYYCKHISLLSDECFDGICRWLLKNIDNLEHVNHNLVDKEALKAGTAYHIKEEDYPLRVRVSAEGLARDLLIWENLNGENQLK